MPRRVRRAGLFRRHGRERQPYETRRRFAAFHDDPAGDRPSGPQRQVRLRHAAIAGRYVGHRTPPGRGGPDRRRDLRCVGHVTGRGQELRRLARGAFERTAAAGSGACHERVDPRWNPGEGESTVGACLDAADSDSVHLRVIDELDLRLAGRPVRTRHDARDVRQRHDLERDVDAGEFLPDRHRHGSRRGSLQHARVIDRGEPAGRRPTLPVEGAVHRRGTRGASRLQGFHDFAVGHAFPHEGRRIETSGGCTHHVVARKESGNPVRATIVHSGAGCRVKRPHASAPDPSIRPDGHANGRIPGVIDDRAGQHSAAREGYGNPRQRLPGQELNRRAEAARSRPLLTVDRLDEPAPGGGDGVPARREAGDVEGARFVRLNSSHDGRRSSRHGHARMRDGPARVGRHDESGDRTPVWRLLPRRSRVPVQRLRPGRPRAQAACRHGQAQRNQPRAADSG